MFILWMTCYDFHIKTTFGSSLPPVFVLSCLRYLCLCAQSGVQYLCFVLFTLFVFVCTEWCPILVFCLVYVICVCVHRVVSNTFVLYFFAFVIAMIIFLLKFFAVGCFLTTALSIKTKLINCQN
jgi:hypothetical protein